MRKAVAIDFDGTIIKDNFPKIEEPIYQALAFCRQCMKSNVALILWTCRTGTDLDDAVNSCKEWGIEFDAINENLPERVEAWKKNHPDNPPDCRKVAADLYIDDKALGGIEWDKAFEWLRKVGYK